MSAVTVEMGGLLFELTFDKPLQAAPIAALYRAFRGAGDGEWHVRVTLDESLTNDMPPLARYDGAYTAFRTMSHAGWIDMASRRAEVSTPSQAKVHSALVRVLSFILMQTLPRRRDGLLVHGAGILFGESGHLFFGASGRGKSTVSRLARGTGRVVCDETILIRRHGAGFRLHSTPFWGMGTPQEDIQEIARAEAPLAAMYALEHGTAFELERLSKGQATMALLTSEKVAIEQNESADAWLAMVDEIVTQVPVYRLAFQPTTELWPFLAEKGVLAPEFATA